MKSRQRHQHSDKPKPKGRATSRRKDEAKVMEDLQEGRGDHGQPDYSDEQSYARGFVSRRMLRDLRRGKYAVQRELDLHGYTRDQAKIELQDFLEACGQSGLTCLRIVHGKGLGSGPDGPVLKGAVNNWLRKWQDVAAFCPARQCDGGSGALYVLLKR